jgi:hypothetical protein
MSMVHTKSTYQGYVADWENVMTLHTAVRRPAPQPEPTIAEAARRMSGATAPTALGAWREVARSGSLPGDPDPDRTAAGLVRRWYQHLAVAIDLPMERLAPGEDRLPELVTAWLDLARRTSAIRAHIAATGGPRTAAESARQHELLAGLLAEDLAVLGAPLPRRSAVDLLDELAAVAEAEDAAGRMLRTARAQLIGGTGATSEPVRTRLDRALDRLVGWLRPAPAA